MPCTLKSGRQGRDTRLWPLRSNTGTGRGGDRILRLPPNVGQYGEKLVEEVSRQAWSMSGSTLSRGRKAARSCAELRRKEPEEWVRPGLAERDLVWHLISFQKRGQHIEPQQGQVKWVLLLLHAEYCGESSSQPPIGAEREKDHWSPPKWAECQGYINLLSKEKFWIEILVLSMSKMKTSVITAGRNRCSRGMKERNTLAKSKHTAHVVWEKTQSMKTRPHKFFML